MTVGSRPLLPLGDDAEIVLRGANALRYNEYEVFDAYVLALREAFDSGGLPGVAGVSEYFTVAYEDETKPFAEKDGTLGTFARSMATVALAHSLPEMRRQIAEHNK